MSESATNVCFRNGSPSPLRLGALATALSVCTTAEKKGMFTVPGDNRGNLSCFSVWSVSPWEWWSGREGRLPSLAVGSSLPAAHSCRHCLLPRSRSPYHRLLLPSYFSSPPAPTLAFRSFLHVWGGADSNSWEKKDITGLIFPTRGKGL